MAEIENALPSIAHTDWLTDFAAQQCPACLETKKAGQAFCLTCCYKLPDSLRNSLYETGEHAYNAAYQSARRWLAEHTGLAPTT